MDFRRYVRALRRNLLLIVGAVVVVTGVAAVFSSQQDVLYESKARVIVSSAQAGTTDAYAGGLLSAQRAVTYVELVESELLASQVRDDLLDDGFSGSATEVDFLLEHVSARVVEDSAVLEVTVESPNVKLAQAAAQAYSDELVTTAADIERPDEGGELPTKITVIDAASFEPSQVSPWWLLNLALGAFGGLLIGLLLTVLREQLDTSIVSPQDVALVTQAPVLGSIPRETAANRRSLVTELASHLPRVESFRVLRTNVQFVDVDREHRLLVVTSSVQEEGKTTTAVNLALTLARAGVRTLLVDGDLRRPQVAGAFGIDQSAGVTTVLLGRVDLDGAIWRHDETGLDVLPSGVTPPNAAELIQTHAMTSLLDDVRSRYDVVIIDSPPLLPVTDAALLAAHADGVLLVVRHGRTKRDQLALSIERLAQVEATPSGIVINDIPTGRGKAGYGSYGTYSGYAPTSSKSDRRRPRRRSRETVA